MTVEVAVTRSARPSPELDPFEFGFRFGFRFRRGPAWARPRTPLRAQPRTQVAPDGHRDVTTIVTGSRSSSSGVDSGALRRTP